MEENKEIKNENNEVVNDELEEAKEQLDENAEENLEENTEINSIENSEEYEEVETIIEDHVIDEKDTEDMQLRDLELKLQELEIKIDEFEFQYADIEKLDDETLEVYLQLKEDYKKLLKEKKEIKKKQKNELGDDNIEQVSMWIFLYGIIMDIFSFPFVSYIVYLNWGSWLIDKLSGLGTLSMDGFFDKLLIWIIIFVLPIALIVLTLTIYFNIIKRKIDKKVFSIFGIIQLLFTLGSIIWLSIVLFS